MIIDKIYYINLPNSKSRAIFMEQQLSYQNIPYERFEAIQPSKKEIQESGKFFKFFKKSKINEIKFWLDPDSQDYNNPKYQLSTLGCYLSHYFLLKKIKKNKEGNVLILEDDCDISSQSALQKLLHFTPPQDWHLLRSAWTSTNLIKKIHYCHPFTKHSKPCDLINLISEMNFNYDKNKNKNPVMQTMFGGTHFQIVNGNQVQDIIDYLDSEFLLPIDALYTTNALNVYHTSFGAKQAGMKSTIHGLSMDS